MGCEMWKQTLSEDLNGFLLHDAIVASQIIPVIKPIASLCIMRNVDETMMETIENERTTKQLHVSFCSLRMDTCNRPGWGFQLASLLQKPWCFKNWRRLPGVESSNIQWSISSYTNAKKATVEDGIDFDSSFVAVLFCHLFDRIETWKNSGC